MKKHKLLLEELLRIIQLCKDVEKKGVDPFEVDVKKALGKLKKYLPEWERLDEHLLDVEALNDISTVIKLQEEWARRRASTLYIDPLLVELKLKALSLDSLARAFMKSWHPIVKTDQLTPQRLRQGLDYWNLLPSLADRLKKEPSPEKVEPRALSFEELIELRALSKDEFNARLRALREELKQLEGYGKGIDYWSFIYRESFADTILRAYLTSFLISEGKASLAIDPLEEKVSIESVDEGERARGPSCSVALSLSYESWLGWQEAKRSG